MHCVDCYILSLNIATFLILLLYNITSEVKNAKQVDISFEMLIRLHNIITVDKLF